ncbi:pachytene checkpoint protein 2, partial [Tremellales sp. Uapishka_1]
MSKSASSSRLPLSLSAAPNGINHMDFDGEGAISRTRKAEDDSKFDDLGEDDDDLFVEDRPVVHVEVRLQPDHPIRASLVKQAVLGWIMESVERLFIESFLETWDDIPMFEENVDRIWVAECSESISSIKTCDVDIQVHVYTPSEETLLTEFAAVTEDEDDHGEPVSSASVRELPSAELDGLWDKCVSRSYATWLALTCLHASLIYPDDVKSNLLRYINTSLLLSDLEIDPNVMSTNRVVLLHGPPGTGKTSLCRALAQKLSIRLSDRYTSGRMVEINSHSLFSKWFSESGKLVEKLFSNVKEMVEDESRFVVVMIGGHEVVYERSSLMELSTDEVESLTAARAGASSAEPSDAIRVVNALLTQLDKLKVYKNVLVMTTSNLVQSIGTDHSPFPSSHVVSDPPADTAFVDRADIVQYIGLPPPQAVYWILASCFEELMAKHLVKPVKILSWKVMRVEQNQRAVGETERSRLVSGRLGELALACQVLGMSGRSLRKLPILAHAKYINDTAMRPIGTWIKAIERVIQEERGQLAKPDGSS